MKQTSKIIFISLVVFLFVSLAGRVHAELPLDPTPTPTVDLRPTPTPTVDLKATPTPTVDLKPTATPLPTGQAQGKTPCSFDSGSSELCNPIKEKTLLDIVIMLVKAFIAIIAVFAVAMVVIGGGRLVISAGNEAEVKKAKSTITWAIGGLVIALLAYSIVSIITNLLQGTV